MRNNVFRSNQRTNNVPHNAFKSFEVRRKRRFMFLRKNYSMKSKCYIFSDYKRTNNVCFVYLE